MTRSFRDPIRYLVNLRYPWANSLRASVGLSASGVIGPSAEEREAKLSPVEAYEAELRTKTPAEIQALCRQVEEAALERILRQRMLDSADYDHWSKAAYWTLEEAVALSMGLSPNEVNPDKMSLEARREGANRLQREPALNYLKRYDLARRAKMTGQLGKTMPPHHFVEWATKHSILLPSELVEKVKAHEPNLIDWKARYEKLMEFTKELQQKNLTIIEEKDATITRWQNLLDEQRAINKQMQEGWKEVVGQREVALHELGKECGTLRAEIEALQSDKQACARLKHLTMTERRSLLSLVIGMAVFGYRYDPRHRKSRQTGEIAGDLHKLGIGLDPDTVRKYLQAGAELLEPSALEAAGL